MQFLFVRSPSDIPSGVPVLGIEIPGNRPELLDRCTLGNIDPQHGGHTAVPIVEDATSAALWAFDAPSAWLRSLPPETVMICCRIDLDAVACMAVLIADDTYGMIDRVNAIDRADSFTAGAWPGPRPLPTPESPWPQIGGAGECEALAAANWVCGWATPAGGNRLTLDQAVAVVGLWLLRDEVPGMSVDMRAGREPLPTWAFGEGDFAGAVEALGTSHHALAVGYLLAIARREATAARTAMIEAIRSGTLPMEATHIWEDGGYVTVHEVAKNDDGSVRWHYVFTDATTSTLPTDSSAGLAYCLSPVSVLRAKDGRYSVAAFDEGRVDFARLKARMNELEPGWGGPARMCSSPMGRPSALSPEHVLRAVRECLI